MNTYDGWVTEKLHKSKIICCGQQTSVSGQGRCVDVGDVTLRRPDPVAGLAEHTRPAVPAEPLNLLGPQRDPLSTRSFKEKLLLGTGVHHQHFPYQNENVCVCVFKHKQTI